MNVVAVAADNVAAVAVVNIAAAVVIYIFADQSATPVRTLQTPANISQQF